jgi:PAS domain S-box-containing protein
MGAEGADAKRVLIVHSFGSAAPPFTTTSVAFETELTERIGERVDLAEVSLDMAHYADPDMQQALVDYLQKRQVKWQPDIVVPVGSPAAIFVSRYRERLFPDTPILYCSLDQRRLPPGSLDKNAAFVGENFNLPGFVEDILQVAPATTNIAVVIGASQLEQYWAAAFRQEFAPFTNRVAFTWLNDLSFDQMLERVSTLPPHSFIFLVLLLRDASGVSHNADEALKRIHAVANAPINSIFQNQLGLGIVGGRLYQAELEGEISARIAIRILHGEPASGFPPEIIGPLPARYDWRELQRWKIAENRLPAGSLIAFREPTVWGRYRGWIIAGITVCALQAAFIFALLGNLARRRRAELSSMESANRLQAILDSAVEGIITFNQLGVIESVNAAAERMFGCSAAELSGQNVSVLIPSHFREKPGVYPGSSCIAIGGREVSGRRKDGSLFPVELVVSEVVLATRRVFTGLVREIGERKQAEQAAREFGGRLLQAQEAERARLARELHDDITQRLARLAIDAGRVESGRDRSGVVMRELREGLVRLSEDIHALSYRLHPSMLADLGLAAALKAECDRFSRETSVRTDVKLIELPEIIPDSAAFCLFRIAQEALRNVARHSGSAVAQVSLRPLDGGLQLAVVDNGVGFDPARQRQRPSLGLASMRERVRLIGGEVEIESAPAKGTIVLAWVPFKGEPS